MNLSSFNATERVLMCLKSPTQGMISEIDRSDVGSRSHFCQTCVTFAGRRICNCYKAVHVGLAEGFC